MSSLDLRVTPGSPTPIYRQIVEQVCHAVASGSRRPGDPLPSIRTLAEQLVVNPNTVAKAYSQLLRDAVIESRQGRGYFIADRRQIYSDAERKRRLDEALQVFLGQALILNFTPVQIRAALDRAGTHSTAKTQGEAETMNEPVIQTKGLTRFFGSKCAVDSLTIDVPAGCVFGLLGRNGCGKTTTVRMMLGLLEPTRGCCTVLGCDSAKLTPQVRARIGYLSEGHHVYGWMRSPRVC